MANLLTALLQGVTGIQPESVTTPPIIPKSSPNAVDPFGKVVNPDANTEVEGIDVVARRRPPPPPPEPIRDPMTPEYIQAVEAANGAKLPRPPGSSAGIWGLLPDKVRNSSLRDVLGAIGDGLLIREGADPIYRPRQEAQRIGQAMLGYGQDPQAAIERIAQTGAPDSIKTAADLQANLQTVEARKAYNEANSDYRKEMIRQRNDSSLQRMTPYISGVIGRAKTPEEYKNAYLRLETIAKRIDPEADPTTAWGLPTPDEWTPEMTESSGMTGGQMSRADISREAIAQRREAAQAASRDRRASIAARNKPQVTSASMVDGVRRRIEAGTASETDKQIWKRYMEGTSGKKGSGGSGGLHPKATGSGGARALPSSSLDAYNKGTPAQKAAARKAWAAQGFDTSKLK